MNRQSIMALLERQGHRCALSGRPLSPETSSLDHKLPVSRGGQHVIGNVQILQNEINRAKGTLTNNEFIALCGEVWCHARANNQDKELV